MSRENIFELEEFNESDLLPERDVVDMKPRPKPRPRTILSGNKVKRSNNKNDGIENDSFSMDEYVVGSSGDHDHDFKSSSTARNLHRNDQNYNDTIPSRMSSSTSSYNNTNEGSSRHPFTVTAEADIHYVRNNPQQASRSQSEVDKSSSSAEDKLDEQRQVENKPTVSIETMLQSRHTKPKPKPRDGNFRLDDTSLITKVTPKRNQTEITIEPHADFSNSDSQEESLTYHDHERDSKVETQQNNDEYLVVTMPTDSKEKVFSNDQQTPSKTSQSSGFLGKWKKAIKTFSKEAVGKSKQNEKLREIEMQANQDIEAEPVSPEDQQDQENAKTSRKKNSKKFRKESQDPFYESQKQTTPTSISSKRNLHRRESNGEICKILGITIHYSDLLPVDPLIVHPVVKVTVMDQDGSYIPKKKISKRGSKGNKESARHEANLSDDDDVAEVARRIKFRLRKSSEDPKKKSLSAKLTNDIILPMLTQPFQMSDYYIAPSFAPTWNELVVFEEAYQKFVHEHSTCIFFFEIMDFLPMDEVGHGSQSIRNYSGSEEGWHKIAWAFLKPVGANGVRNVNRKLRLQLYRPERLTSREAKMGPEIYCWWKLGKRTKVNSTLYVTVKGITPSSCPNANLKTLITMRKADLTEALIDSQLKHEESQDEVDHSKSKDKSGLAESKKPAKIIVKEPPQWTRLKGQSCKPPNKLLKSLPSSDFDSLKMSISGNVHCVKFSPCGLLLAAGFDTEQLHTILIFEIPSGVLNKSLRCHHGLIYDLAWAKNIELLSRSRATGVSDNYLASASADTTASIWRINSYDNSVHSIKTLLHPTFVYCVRFHPKDSHLVATGCFDHIIRIWSIFQDSSSKSFPDHQDSTPLIMLDRHTSFVNCLEFHPAGKYLFSGDGEGSVYKWKNSSSNSTNNWKVDRNIKLLENSKIPINSINIDPVNGTKLLVHCRQSCLKIVDVDTFLILHTFHGFTNEKFNLRSCFSPCGNLVLSGSEDSTFCIWDADTTRILQFIRPETQSNSDDFIVTSVDYHPLDYYVAVGILSSTSNCEPCPILLYGYSAPPKLQLSTLTKMKAFGRNNRHQKELEVKNGPVHGDDRRTIKRDKLRNEVVNSRSQSPAAPRNLNPQESVDSTNKFMSILWKLDTALKVTSNLSMKVDEDRDSESKVKPSGESEFPPIHPNIPVKIKRRKSSKTTATANQEKSINESNDQEYSKIEMQVNDEHTKSKNASEKPKKSLKPTKIEYPNPENSGKIPPSPKYNRETHHNRHNSSESPKKHSRKDFEDSQIKSSKEHLDLESPKKAMNVPPSTLNQFHVESASENNNTTNTSSKRLQRRQKMHVID